MFLLIWKDSSPGSSRDNSLRLLLIGECGSGKSSVGNYLAGLRLFSIRPGKTCWLHWKTEETSQFLEMTKTHCIGASDYQHFTRQEFDRCLHALSPGPHAVLLCMRLHQGQSMTQYQLKTYTLIRNLLGDDLVHQRTILVLSGLDSFYSKSHEDDDSRSGLSVETTTNTTNHDAVSTTQKIESAQASMMEQVTNDELFASLLSDIGFLNSDGQILCNKIFCMDNRDRDPDTSDRRGQGHDLLKLIKVVVNSNGGSHFVDDRFSVIEERMAVAVQRLQQRSSSSSPSWWFRADLIRKVVDGKIENLPKLEEKQPKRPCCII